MCLAVFTEALFSLLFPLFIQICCYSQTNRWRAAICKTEQGGCIDLQRRQHEERDMKGGGGRGRQRQKQECRKGENRKLRCYGWINSPLRHGHSWLVPQHGPCGSVSAPAGRKLTFEISLLRQGERWWSLSSRDHASVCKYREGADGGKLASALEPYGAYAHGGVCKDPGHGVQAEDRCLLRLAQDTRRRHWHWWGVTVSPNFSWKPQNWRKKLQATFLHQRLLFHA